MSIYIYIYIPFSNFLKTQRRRNVQECPRISGPWHEDCLGVYEVVEASLVVRRRVYEFLVKYLRISNSVQECPCPRMSRERIGMPRNVQTSRDTECLPSKGKECLATSRHTSISDLQKLSYALPDTHSQSNISQTLQTSPTGAKSYQEKSLLELLKHYQTSPTRACVSFFFSNIQKIQNVTSAKEYLGMHRSVQECLRLPWSAQELAGVARHGQGCLQVSR